LTLDEFQEGMEDGWINKRDVNVLDSMEKVLLDRFKIFYQSGKGRSLVPLLLPEDTFAALKILADPERRRDALVSNKNPFLFPPTNSNQKIWGQNHVQGWSVLKAYRMQVQSILQGIAITCRPTSHRYSCRKKRRIYSSIIWVTLQK